MKSSKMILLLAAMLAVHQGRSTKLALNRASSAFLGGWGVADRLDNPCRDVFMAMRVDLGLLHGRILALSV